MSAEKPQRGGEIGRLLRSIRRRSARRLSAQRVAAKLQVARKTVLRWETGECEPPLPAAMAYLEVAGSSLSELERLHRGEKPPELALEVAKELRRISGDG